MPHGKNAHWTNLITGTSVMLYEPSTPDFAIIRVTDIVGQAFLMPNFETPTIPYYMQRLKGKVFPYGQSDSRQRKSGSKLWVVNDVAMWHGRSTVSA